MLRLMLIKWISFFKGIFKLIFFILFFFFDVCACFKHYDTWSSSFIIIDVVVTIYKFSFTFCFYSIVTITRFRSTKISDFSWDWHEITLFISASMNMHYLFTNINVNKARKLQQFLFVLGWVLSEMPYIWAVWRNFFSFSVHVS